MVLLLIILGVALVIVLFRLSKLTRLLQQKQHLDEQAKQILAQDVARLTQRKQQLDTAYATEYDKYSKEVTNWKVLAAQSEATARTEAKAETERLRQTLNAEYEAYQTEVTFQTQELHDKLENYREQVNGILTPLQTLAKSEADARYYCLALPDTDNADIQYLVENVAPHIHNANLIPKLCWTEYVSKAYADLAAKTGIKDEPGIYKITNITTKKCYVGKAVSIKKRLADHLKGACGMTTIADQAIHHAIVDEGFNNWTFEVICYCDKEQLNEREQFYINELHAIQWGYNRNAGGGG